MSDASAPSRRSLVALARPYFGTLLLGVLLLVIAGTYSVSRIPCGIYPEVAFPRIAIIATASGLSIQSVETSVTRTLEDAVSVVVGAVRVRSKTVRGAAELSVQFDPDTDMIQALNDVRARIAETNASLPAGTRLIVERQTPSIFPILSVVVSGDRSPSDLRDYAFYDLKPRFSRIPDVSFVTVQGGDVREIIVQVDPLALVGARLSIDQVAAQLARDARLQAVGRIDRETLQYQVMADTLSGVLDDLEDLALSGAALATPAAGAEATQASGAPPESQPPQAPLRLRDVAQVSVGHEDRTVAVSSRGEEAVAVTVFRRLGGNALEVSRGVREVLAEAARSAPRRVRARVAYDQAGLVKTSLANVRDAILLGGLFSVLTLFFFLHSWRATAIAALSIPTTLLISFTILRLTGDTLNLMSLGGLAIAIGIIIDDTVVVIENIARHLQRGQAVEGAVDEASREISGAVIGSTLTTVLVFVPLAFLSGVVGQFFQSLCLALGIAVMVSLVISLTVIPMLAARFLAGQALPPSGRLFAASAALYERALRAGLGRPRLVLVASVLAVVPGYLLSRGVERGFMPEIDEGAFVLDYFMPVGTSLVETDRVLREVEAVLGEVPEVEDAIRRTGAELGFFATEAYTGDILISLAAQRSRRMEEVMEEVRQKVAERVPELEVELVPLVMDQIGDLAGVEAPIEVKVLGPDYGVLRGIAAEVGALLEEVPGVVDVDAHVREGNPDILVRTDSSAAQRAGLSAADVEAQLSASLYGQVAFVLPEEDRLTNVRVRYPDAVRFDLDALERTPIIASDGSPVPLRQVARIERQRSLNELWRENQQPLLEVTAELEGRDLGSVTSDIAEALTGLVMPRGYRVEIAGDYQSQREAFWNLGLVLLAGGALVFLLLAIQFQSLALPLLIFLTQPVSLTCALAALWVTGTPLNVSSYMGAILLIGLDVKNGILLIESVGRFRASGLPLEAALLEAGRSRFRPILMTSLTTILGLAPLALGVGPGAQMQQPLAIAVMGGLTANMLFTRLIIPVGYRVLTRSR